MRDVVVPIVLGMLSMLGLVIPAWLGQRRQHRRVNKKLNRIDDQVSNTHDTNLRDDLDVLRDLLRDGLHEIRRDIGGLREELRTERSERIEGDRLRILRGGMQ